MLLEPCAVYVDASTERKILSIWCFCIQLCAFLCLLYLKEISRKVQSWQEPYQWREGFAEKAGSVQLPADLRHLSSPLQIKLIICDLVLFAHLGEIWEMVSFSTTVSFPGLLLSADNVGRSSLCHEHIQGCYVLSSSYCHNPHHIYAWWLTFNLKFKASETCYSTCLKHSCFVYHWC